MHFIYKVILINAFVNVNAQFFSEIHAITHGAVEAYGSLFKRYSTFLVTTNFSICLYFYLSIIYLSVCLSVCLPVCLSIYLSIYGIYIVKPLN